MNIDTLNLAETLGQPESDHLAYQAVLPPARTLAKIVSAFANSSGGTIILGVLVYPKFRVIGLSDDFRANEVLKKALGMLSSMPDIEFGYREYEQVRLYVILIGRSSQPISIDEKIFIRNDHKIILSNPSKITLINAHPSIKAFSSTLLGFEKSCSDSFSRLIDHYKSVTILLADMENKLYPNGIENLTDNKEGKILIKMLFSSCADNFENYLADLLYEIYLGNSSVLKSADNVVSVKEVLECEDIPDFIATFARKKVGKLQRGNVKGFLTDTKQISDLGALTKKQIKQIEEILQIRHLYVHKNGIVDDKFLEYFHGQYTLHQPHQISIKTFLSYFDYLITVGYDIDKAAIKKYNLSNS